MNQEQLETIKTSLTARADLDPHPYGDACSLVTEKKFRRLAHSAGWTINEIELGVDTMPRVDGKILLTANQPERKTKPHRGTMAQFAQQYGIAMKSDRNLGEIENCDDGLCLWIGCSRCNPDKKPSPDGGQYLLSTATAH